MNTISEFMMTTTPQLQSFRVRKMLGVASGLTARTRGFGGKLVAGFQSLASVEVTAFASEMEKARIEPLQRLKDNAAVWERTRS